MPGCTTVLPLPHGRFCFPTGLAGTAELSDLGISTMRPVLDYRVAMKAIAGDRRASYDRIASSYN
jgi:hypothetical protein